ncbi:MAG: hypothetical protein RLZZ206_2164 [Cyanobacteriota bacterium]|jgi:hypothetical protein
MLKESKNTSQIPNEYFWRWFCDDNIDLIVWYDPDDSIIGFQLCYNKFVDEHALTWFRGKGFSHNKVDDGEGPDVRFKMSPILIPDGVFDKNTLLTLFENESKDIDQEIVELVTEMIKKYPKGQ